MSDKSGSSAPVPPARLEPYALMSSAPLVYNQDGTVAWERIWCTFCELASKGGPPYRGEMLAAPTDEDPTTATYQRVAAELIRGIRLVSKLEAAPAAPGWLAVRCAHAAQALWMSKQIFHENVHSYAEGDRFFVPIASNYAISEEIKAVIAVVAKTAHFWQAHVFNEVRALMAWESRIVHALCAWDHLPEK